MRWTTAGSGLTKVCALLGININQLYKLTAQGLPHHKHGGHVRFRYSEIVNWRLGED